jgi:hypothetical protein
MQQQILYSNRNGYSLTRVAKEDEKAGSFQMNVALEGIAVFLRIKHSLSNEVASKATSLPGYCSWNVFNNA